MSVKCRNFGDKTFLSIDRTASLFQLQISRHVVLYMLFCEKIGSGRRWRLQLNAMGLKADFIRQILKKRTVDPLKIHCFIPMVINCRQFAQFISFGHASTAALNSK